MRPYTRYLRIALSIVLAAGLGAGGTTEAFMEEGRIVRVYSGGGRLEPPGDESLTVRRHLSDDRNRLTLCDRLR